jgi:hypothetical protein
LLDRFGQEDQVASCLDVSAKRFTNRRLIIHYQAV